MNSPPDPGSPISTDTESPPPEEINAQTASASGHFSNLATQLAQSFGGGAKRRLPGGPSFGGPSAMRDSKMRRRMEQGKGASANPTSSSIAGWDGSKAETKREERELVDHAIVDYLRKEVGDPFQEVSIHARA